jgi:hypothetical protein
MTDSRGPEQHVGPGKVERLGAYVVVAALLTVWLCAKVLLFRKLEYVSDLYLHMQAARNYFSFWPPRTNFGYITTFHNYYSIGLFYPLVRWLDVYGIFVGHLALLGLACVRILQLDTADKHARAVAVAVVLSLVLGPVGFWLWDNPIYGFGLDSVMFPFTLLFATELLRGSRSVWLWGTLVVASHEAGPVLLCSIQLMLRIVAARPGRLWETKWWRGTLVVVVAWLTIFAAGLAFLRYVEHVTGTNENLGRLTDVLQTVPVVFREARLRAAMGDMLIGTAVLCGSGLVWVLPLWRRLPVAVGALAVAIVPIVVITALASLHYREPGQTNNLIYHGMTWPPRFSFIWAIITTLVIALAHVPRGALGNRVHGVTALVLLLLSILLQGWALQRVRGYDIVGRIRAAFDPQNLMSKQALSRQEDEYLSCLAASLPRRTSVMLNTNLFGYFHRQDFVWPGLEDRAVSRPYIAVCEEAGKVIKAAALPSSGLAFFTNGDYGCRAYAERLHAQGFARLQVGDIRATFAEQYRPYIEPCWRPRQ